MQSHPTSHPQYRKGKKDIHKIWLMFTKDTHSKPNEQLFPKRVVSKLPKLKIAVTSIFTYFLFYITKQNKPGSIMGKCYLNDYIA